LERAWTRLRVDHEPPDAQRAKGAGNYHRTPGPSAWVGGMVDALLASIMIEQ